MNNKINPTSPAILVVEDEPVLREMIEIILEDITASVTAVGTADEGFQALHSQAWKLIITDVCTPGGTNGLQLAIVARQHQPQVGGIVMSGFYDEMSVPLPPGVNFLAKPWSSAEFFALVEAQLV